MSLKHQQDVQAALQPHHAFPPTVTALHVRGSLGEVRPLLLCTWSTLRDMKLLKPRNNNPFFLELTGCSRPKLAFLPWYSHSLPPPAVYFVFEPSSDV